jgi:hypothetical protein
MRNITFSADEQVIEAAREQALADNSTLNEQFRRWLEQYARQRRAAKALAVMDRIGQYARSGGRSFTRAERNERKP